MLNQISYLSYHLRLGALQLLVVTIVLASLAGLGLSASVLALEGLSPTEHLSAEDSDPAKMGWMQGSPPAPDRIVRFADGSFFEFPARRWSVSNFRQLMPTANISSGSEAKSALPLSLSNSLDSFNIEIKGSGETIDLEAFIDQTYTDGLIIMHRGTVIFERYTGVLQRDVQHAAMSISKTFVGTLAAALIAEGTLDESKRAIDYIPEITESAYANATVRQILDMTTGIRFTENYSDPKSDIWIHSAAGNPLPKPPNYAGPRTYYEYLQSVKPDGVHGEGFRYRTINTDMLGWIVARATGKDLTTLLSERFWKPMGMEYDAYIGVDSIGTPFAGGGLSLTLRDMARFGEMIRNYGQFNERQIIPASVVKDIEQGGDRVKFRAGGFGGPLDGWSYRNMWWITHNEHRAYMARGVFGQSLYIDPTAELVIARFASHPIAANAANDGISLPVYHALAKFVMNTAQASNNGHKQNLSN